MRKEFFCIMIISTIFLAFGCASSASIKGMTVEDYRFSSKKGETIYIHESYGGEETIPFHKSTISDKNFTIALKESIINSSAFSKISNVIGDGWELQINILNVDQPLFAFDITVTTVILYKLTHNKSIVLKKTISQSGTVKLSDSFLAVKRLRLANEEAARNNIRAFLKELEAINLKEINN